MIKKLLVFLFVLLSSVLWAAESPYDTYNHATECPENGQDYENRLVTDSNSFVRCQCVSYVAEKLSDLLAARYYNNGAPSNLAKDFQNGQYYMPQSSRKWPNGPNSGQTVTRWSHALYWRDSARYAGIGITGAWDHFTWEEGSYNAVFKGDVAWWDKWGSNDYGHVAIVESATPDVAGQGVACVVVSDYNMIKHTFDKRTLCKSTHSNTDSRKRFPDAFLHIDKDHAYCVAHSTTDNCTALWGGQMVASAGGKMDGLGGGSDNFNLKVNSFGVWNASGVKLTPDTSRVTSGQVVTVKVQVKAKDGNTSTHMRPGKNRIEADIYVRQDTGDWVFLKREYIQAVNLPSGATHTESVTYTIPQGVREVSFKAKIDAEDEAYEANEGDNWTEIQTFQMDFSWLIPIINLILED